MYNIDKQCFTYLVVITVKHKVTNKNAFTTTKIVLVGEKVDTRAKPSKKLHVQTVVIGMIQHNSRIYTNKKSLRLKAFDVVPLGIEPRTHGFSVRCSTS